MIKPCKIDKIPKGFDPRNGNVAFLDKHLEYVLTEAYDYIHHVAIEVATHGDQWDNGMDSLIELGKIVSNRLFGVGHDLICAREAQIRNTSGEQEREQCPLPH
jgi:hypothetical protein